MAGNLSLRFWGAERLVLQQPGRWEVRSWPDWQLLEAGGGTARAKSGGDRLAVVAPDDTIRVDGSAPLTLPPAAGRLTDLAWSGGSLVVAARTTARPGSAHPAGVSARRFGAPPAERVSLWRLPLDGTSATWLYDAPPGIRIWGIQDLGSEVLVEHYPYGDSQPAAAPRLVVIAGDRQTHDLAPTLPGACCDAAVGPDGRVAFLHGDFPHSELVFPTWFALVEGTQGRWRTLLPPQLRWARPRWAADGGCLVLTAVQGFRSGIVTVDPATGHWQWCALETAASYRSPTMATGGGEVVALRQPLDGQPAIVAVRGRHRRVLQPLGEPVATHGRWRIHTWQGPDGALEGILVMPLTGSAPWPLVVDLHAGPQGGLVVGNPDHLAHLDAWCQHGFAAFAPDFRGSGILGREAVLAALHGDGLPDDDREATDVLSGVESVLGTGLADPQRLYLFGHSYGAYLLNRILTVDHRFVAAVCWEGVADLRLLDALQGGSAAQRAWRGGSPLEAPQRWAAASPATRADRVRTPLLLVYGQHGIGPTHGVAWLTALRDHGLPCELVLYDDEGHLFRRPENKADMVARAAAWFRQHQTNPNDQADRLLPVTQEGRIVAMSRSLVQWLRALRQVPALGAGRWRRLPGVLLAWRDAVPFVRLHFLAVATDLGLLEELRHRPAAASQLGARLAISDRALLEAFLRLGAALGELRCRAGRWSLRGRRSTALAAPQADTMRAMVQEALRYDAAVYAGLAAHLRGAPPGDYLHTTGAVIAQASRLAEPVLAPLLRSLVAERHPRRVLDAGCGTGIYLAHAAAAGGPQLTGLGVDLARQRLANAGLAERFPVRHADVRTAELPTAWFDLVLLFQNIYYFAEDERPGLLRRLHGLLAPDGALVLASLTAGRSLAATHYDLLFRATAGCGPLPRRQQLDRQLHDAGFTTTRWMQLIPLQSFHAVVAER